jgi:hypothetical protein
MAYVYRHIRLDKNEPFYIGIGKINNYKRAYLKSIRNVIWKQIVNKTDYDIEIIADNLTWEQACQKEIEFISLYGRIDIKTGSLSNMTNGGDGALGKICKESTKKKISIKTTGIKRSLDTKQKLSKINGDKASAFKYYINAYKNGEFLGKFDGSGHCAKVLNIHQSSILKYLRGNLKTYKDYHFKIYKKL